jgi:Predicted transcriptional regulators
MSDKSEYAFRTISEVSDELGVPQHVLRFWETKFGQLRPMKRAGGRRYYRPSDLELIATIKMLLDDRGLTLKAAQKVLREHGVEAAKTVSVAPAHNFEAAPEPAAQQSEMPNIRPESVDLSEVKDALASLKELRAKFA